MYKADWFESEFMPSLFQWFCKSTDYQGYDNINEHKPCFISAKQYNVFAKNSDMKADGVFENRYSDLKVICEKRVSKTGSTYYTVNFIDDYIEKFRKSGEYVLNHLLDLRSQEFPKLKEYAQAYYDVFMSLLHTCEIEFEYITSPDDPDDQHARQLYQFCSDELQAIGKFIE